MEKFSLFVDFVLFVKQIKSNILSQVIAQVGCTLGNGDCDSGHFAMLVFGCVLIDSGAMALPVTSFPNAQCFGLEVRSNFFF